MIFVVNNDAEDSEEDGHEAPEDDEEDGREDWNVALTFLSSLVMGSNVQLSVCY